MLIAGSWTLCDDGITRPVIESEVLGADGIALNTHRVFGSCSRRVDIFEPVARGGKGVACFRGGRNQVGPQLCVVAVIASDEICEPVRGSIVRFTFFTRGDKAHSGDCTRLPLRGSEACINANLQ